MGFRRRNFFINKPLQFRFALMASAVILFSTAGVWVLLHWILKTSIVQHWGNNPTDIEILQKTNFIVLGVVLADVVTIFLLSITFSHAIAGPLYRIEKALSELLATGHARPISLRKYDMLQETASAVNKVLHKFGHPSPK